MSTTVSQKLRSKIIANGVRNLHEFGYPEANEDNIFSDPIYATFFLTMLKDSENASIQDLPEVKQLVKEATEASQK